jgi:hypothetical protein
LSTLDDKIHGNHIQPIHPLGAELKCVVEVKVFAVTFSRRRIITQLLLQVLECLPFETTIEELLQVVFEFALVHGRLR